MKMTFLTLVGFSAFTFCHSICPMNMGGMDAMMSMDHGEMQMMEHAMDMSNDKKDMPCEQCERESEDIAFSTLSTEIQSVAKALYAVFSFTSFAPEIAYKQSLGLPLANTGPPPQPHSLVGTVILRT